VELTVVRSVNILTKAVNYKYPYIHSRNKWMVLKTTDINFPLLTTTHYRYTRTHTTDQPAAHSLHQTWSKPSHTHHTQFAIFLIKTVLCLLNWSVRNLKERNKKN